MKQKGKKVLTYSERRIKLQCDCSDSHGCALPEKLLEEDSASSEDVDVVSRCCAAAFNKECDRRLPDFVLSVLLLAPLLLHC